MLNHVLALLDNNVTPPGLVPWPVFTQKQDTPLRLALLPRLSSRAATFVRAYALDRVIQASPLAKRANVDPRRAGRWAELDAQLTLRGLIVTATPASAPRLDVVYTEKTPAFGAWEVVALSPTEASVSFEAGDPVVVSIVPQEQTLLAGDTIRLVWAASPIAGDKWTIILQEPGTPWVYQTFERALTIPPDTLPSDLRSYARGQSGLDRLVATLVHMLETSV